MSLTEDWQNGNLKDGWYYVECIDGKICIDFFDNYFSGLYGGAWENFDEGIIKRVLSTVPSYEELHGGITARLCCKERK